MSLVVSLVMSLVVSLVMYWCHYISILYNTPHTHRYGPIHPMFFIGSLADAVKEATGGLAATRKPLLLYLHHDRSILSNVFCSQLLCSESIVNYLSLHFVCWGWDLTAIQLRDQWVELYTLCICMYVYINGLIMLFSYVVHTFYQLSCIPELQSRSWQYDIGYRIVQI